MRITFTAGVYVPQMIGTIANVIYLESAVSKILLGDATSFLTEDSSNGSNSACNFISMLLSWTRPPAKL